MRAFSVLRVLVGLALLPEAAIAGYIAFGGDVERWAPIDPHGVKIDGEVIATKDARELIARHAKTILDRTVELALDGRSLGEFSLADLGAAIDPDEVLAHLHRVGAGNDLLTRLALAKRIERGEIDLPIVPTVDATALLARLLPLKEVEDTSPVSARLDLDHHAVIPEKQGVYIDVDGARDLVTRAAMDPGVHKIDLPVARFDPRVSSDFLAKLDIHTVLSEYETYFSRGGEQVRRGKNIDVASSKLDGLVLSPGELVSFNAVVGERSEENGFAKSWEIFKGEMVEGIGGGTCQVASTFHAAVFFAGLDVLERLPHSRPSAYIPMGLDSTVVYPSVDLKIRNPYAFPIVVHTKTDANKLKIELLGASPPPKVSFGREILARIPYARKVVEEPSLAGKTVLVKQHGIAGFRIKRSRMLTYANGTKKIEHTTDVYPPTTEIYEVPVGFDTALLPALPAQDENGATAGSAPAPAPVANASAPMAANASVASDLEFVEAPGAHLPTAGQANPAKTVWMDR